jgi:hypothetical protein
VTLTLTAPTAGSKSITRTAPLDPDGNWQVEGELAQPDDWVVGVRAALGPAGRLTISAPIVIESNR